MPINNVAMQDSFVQGQKVQGEGQSAMRACKALQFAFLLYLLYFCPKSCRTKYIFYRCAIYWSI
jgi:hypothetical protein